MRKLAVSALVVLACACGDDSDPVLEGKWHARDSDGCATGLVFDGDRFERIYACPLDDGTFGYESYRGTFTQAGDTLLVSITASSCADAEAHEENLHYEFVGKGLRVTSDAGLQLFERIPASTGGTGTASYGCYDGDAFNPSPVRPVR